jgi:hypothetical protein
MFTGVVGTPQIPFTMPALTIVQFFEADTVGDYAVTTRLTHFESGQQLVEARANIRVTQPGSVMAPLQLRNIRVSAYGTYHVATELPDHAPILASFQVAIVQPPPPQQMVPLRR